MLVGPLFLVFGKLSVQFLMGLFFEFELYELIHFG